MKAEKTKASSKWWTRAWNPVTGCSPISEGCENCWAARMANRLKGRAGYPADDPFKVTFHPERLADPVHWRKGQDIFVEDMGDLFHGEVKTDWQLVVWHTMREYLRHRFYVLTKRAENMRQFCRELRPSDLCGNLLPLENVWLGVTAENQARFDERVPLLLQTPAAHRYVCLEPLLGPIEMADSVRRLNWVIVGCESGPGRRLCRLEWIESIVGQCKAAGVPCFVKQVGLTKRRGEMYAGTRVSHDPAEWPEEIRVRGKP